MRRDVERSQEAEVIDSQVERLITLREAAAGLPCRRAGRRTHVATIFRWTTVGVRGVVLESLQVGGVRCTSAEALQRFFERCTDQGGGPPAPAARTTAARQRAIAAAEKELERLGV
jgi:hypothetical protein